MGVVARLEGLSPRMALEFVEATAQHLPDLLDLILTQGPNEWNWLPLDGVHAHVDDIAHGRARAVLALDHGQLVGAVTFCFTLDFSRYQSPAEAQAEQGYVCEAVVRADQAGRGLGTALLKKAVVLMAEQGVDTVYIDRHEENAASAGMMRKAGFVEIDTFAEPARRPHGSGRTTVCRVQTSPPGR
jgi:ribosomal protein S18 acetylase RimI-like enzyme